MFIIVGFMGVLSWNGVIIGVTDVMLDRSGKECRLVEAKGWAYFMRPSDRCRGSYTLLNEPADRSHGSYYSMGRQMGPWILLPNGALDRCSVERCRGSYSLICVKWDAYERGCLETMTSCIVGRIVTWNITPRGTFYHGFFQH
jgi:hypothetical protein